MLSSHPTATKQLLSPWILQTPNSKEEEEEEEEEEVTTAENHIILRRSFPFIYAAQEEPTIGLETMIAYILSEKSCTWISRPGGHLRRKIAGVLPQTFPSDTVSRIIA